MKTLAYSVCLIPVDDAPVAADNHAPRSLRERFQERPCPARPEARWARRLALVAAGPDRDPAADSAAQTGPVPGGTGDATATDAATDADADTEEPPRRVESPVPGAPAEAPAAHGTPALSDDRQPAPAPRLGAVEPPAARVGRDSPPGTDGRIVTEASSRPESDALKSCDDTALVFALRHDVPGAASVLWRRYLPLVRGVLRRTMRNHYDLDDLAQDVFLRAFQRIGALRDPAALRGFLYGIAVHVAQDELRRRRRHVELIGKVAAIDDERVVDTSIQARLGLRRLHDLLARMRPDVRQAFALREFEQLELDEIARTLGCSMATVKRLLVRARAIVEAAASQDPMLARYI